MNTPVHLAHAIPSSLALSVLGVSRSTFNSWVSRGHLAGIVAETDPGKDRALSFESVVRLAIALEAASDFGVDLRQAIAILDLQPGDFVRNAIAAVRASEDDWFSIVTWSGAASEGGRTSGGTQNLQAVIKAATTSNRVLIVNLSATVRRILRAIQRDETE